ncbi:hypothetical protein ACH4PU_12190 [Streptomyces sp. NPDC021100]
MNTWLKSSSSDRDGTDRVEWAPAAAGSRLVSAIKDGAFSA